MPSLTRAQTSAAVRRGINRVLKREQMPAEVDGWETRQSPNTPSQPDEPMRLLCGRYVREELRNEGAPANSTSQMRSVKIANPGEKPGTIKNAVDFCFSKL